MQKKQHKILAWVLNACVLIPPIFYFSIVNTYALNIPYSDDYDAILAFLNKFVSSGSTEKVALLFSQHNEHRILFSRIIFVLYYEAVGAISFRNLIFIGNIELAGVFIIIIYFIRKAIPGYWNIAAIILSLCLFDLSNFENSGSAMAGVQNYGVILLFLLGILFYSLKSNQYLVPAFLFQALIVFSSGNGMIGSLCMLFFTILLKDKPRIIISGACLIIFAPLYFLHYNKTGTAPVNTLAEYSTYFIRHAGAVFNFKYSFYLGICLLIILAVSLPVTKKLRLAENTAPFLSLLLFILISIAAIAYFRSSLKGINFYTSRYLVYPHLLAAIVFIFAYIKLRAEKIRLVISLAFIVAMVLVNVQNSRWGEMGLKIAYTRLTNYPFVYPDKERAKQLSDESCRLKIYCIEKHRESDLHFIFDK
ncbi:MAG: hypothetical protein ABIQ31_21380 [Ferruginibacter sp.]